jgi:hypothetical protein
MDRCHTWARLVLADNLLKFPHESPTVHSDPCWTILVVEGFWWLSKLHVKQSMICNCKIFQLW